MDGSRFDALTRRGFGRATGGLAAALLGLLAHEQARAKQGKKKKKKRCKKFDQGCAPGNRNRKCCPGLACEMGACCKKLGAKCTDGSECCGDGICGDVEGGNPEVTICCSLADGPCQKTGDCCVTFACDQGTKKCVP